jgi:hypothetical protein
MEDETMTEHPSPHVELGMHESAACEPDAWERWIASVERLLGHGADGDHDIDGYSLDGYYLAWERGLKPGEAIDAARRGEQRSA